MVRKTGKTQGKRSSAEGRTRPRRLRLTPEERRTQIVAAAKEPFVTDGIDHLSLIPL